MSKFTDIVENARLTTRALIEFGEHIRHPTVRLGVTGMSGAGKTVFIAALVHGLTNGGRFPVFEAMASGRLARASLAPQPDHQVPRFEYESHIDALISDRRWPESTRHISELRIAIEYQSRRGSERSLALDIVDYPGEWLLDLPLLTQTYDQWATESLARSRQYPRSLVASKWHQYLTSLDPHAPEDEQVALSSARLFTEYLIACRDERYAMSGLAPGRFLMPGDLAGSPAVTFAPLALPEGGSATRNSLWKMMQRRFEAYKNVVVRPFFREHFARLDRQIVLVDALASLNAGPGAVRDLEDALSAILECFRVGRRTLLSSIIRPRIDRILFAATKADHLHHTNHDRLEAILRRMTERAAKKAAYSGATVDVIALASVRATSEAMVRRGREQLPSIIGTPAAGEIVNGETFDGNTEVALFPGDLPADPETLFAPDGGFRGLSSGPSQEADFRFLRLRPPLLPRNDGSPPSLPHIRLDRAIQFLIGDRLQ